MSREDREREATEREFGVSFRWRGKEPNRVRAFATPGDFDRWLRGRFASVDRARWGEHPSVSIEQLVVANADRIAEAFLEARARDLFLQGMPLGEAMAWWVAREFDCGARPQDLPTLCYRVIAREAQQRTERERGGPMMRRTCDIVRDGEERFEAAIEALAARGVRPPRFRGEDDENARPATDYILAICRTEAEARGEVFVDAAVKAMPDVGVHVRVPGQEG